MPHGYKEMIKYLKKSVNYTTNAFNSKRLILDGNDTILLADSFFQYCNITY